MHHQIACISAIALLLVPSFSDGSDTDLRVSPVFEAIYERFLPAHEDADNDGHTNFMEYLIGSNPLDPKSPGDFGLTLTDVTVRIWIPGETGLRFKLQISPNPGEWDDEGEFKIADGSRDFAEISVEGVQRLFFRIKAAPPLDSDEDGLNAWEEAKLGADPLLVGTDGDRIIDRDEFEEGSRSNQSRFPSFCHFGKSSPCDPGCTMSPPLPT